MEKLPLDSIFDLGNCPYRRTPESACFLVWALPEVQNQIRQQFSHKVLHNFLTNFFWTVLVYIYKSKLLDFPIYFQFLRKRNPEFFLPIIN